MSRLFFLSLFTALMFNASGQTDSLGEEILGFEDKQIKLIRNGRSMLLENFLDGDYEKVQSVMHYLETQVENENYMALYDFEKWLLYYWTGDYQKLLGNFRHLSDSLFLFRMPASIPPPSDLLATKLLEQTNWQYESLQSNLDATGLQPVDKGFVKILLDYLVFIGNGETDPVTQLNESSIAYLQKFPDSDYRYFVEHFINQEETLANFGMDFEFFSGYAFYDKGLQENFSHHVPIGVAFDFYYKKWILGLRDHIGIGKLQQEIVSDKATWAEGARFNHVMLEISVAYEVFDNHRFKVFPFGGISFSGFDAPEGARKDHPEYEDVGLNFRPAAVAGLNLDIKLSSPYTDNPRWRDGYGILRIRGAYNLMNFDKKYPGFDGNTFYLSVGIGGVARRVVKKYGNPLVFR